MILLAALNLPSWCKFSLRSPLVAAGRNYGNAKESGTFEIFLIFLTRYKYILANWEERAKSC